MYKIIDLLSLFISALIFSLSATSCVNDSPQTPDDIDKRSIIFTLSLDSSSTRSDNDTWGDDYSAAEHENDFENRIDISNVKVDIYNDKGAVCSSSLLVFMHKTIDSTTLQNIYTFSSAIDFEPQPGVLYKFVVTANSPGGNNRFSISDLDSYIPLWGFTTDTLDDSSNGVTKYMNIRLLRAVAKASVEIDPAVDDFEITEATMLNVAAEGFTAPAFDSWFDVLNTQNISIAGSFRPISGDLLDERGLIKKIDASLANNAWVAYIPERNNMETEDFNQITEFLITIRRISDGTTYKNVPLEFVERDAAGSIIFDENEDVTPVNIIRNHYYAFSITGISGSNPTEISLSYSIVSANHISLDIPTFE